MKAFRVVLVYLVGVLLFEAERSLKKVFHIFGGISFTLFYRTLLSIPVLARTDTHFGNSNIKGELPLVSSGIWTGALSRNHSLFKAPAALFSLSLFLASSFFLVSVLSSWFNPSRIPHSVSKTPSPEIDSEWTEARLKGPPCCRGKTEVGGAEGLS